MNRTTPHHHYNPDWLSDDALVGNFVARLDEFVFLRDELAHAPREGSTQHYLLVGVRGAGKTTLLKRLAVAIRRDTDLRDHLIALSFPEELYQVKNLSDFWWAACEALADELDRLKQTDVADRLMAVIAQAKKGGATANPLSDAGFKVLQQHCAALGLRPVLLVDNLDMVFQRIDKSGRKLKDPHAPAYWALREALSTTTSPIVIGGSVRLSEPFTDYDKAFYDFFIPKRLGKLGLAEVRQVLLRLADAQGVPEVKQRLEQRPSRIEALYELTGGNPRALGLIFELLRQGPNSRAVEDFERLMDITTPYYKARFEDLSEQAQVVMHALAVCRPDDAGGLRFGLTAAEIGQQAGLPTGTVSAQLDTLEREGLAEKSAAHGRTQYRIAEQLFRLWLQMRGSRRIRQNVIGLTQFLEAMFSQKEMQAGLHGPNGANPLKEARFTFATADTRTALPLRRGLEAKGADHLLLHIKTHGGELEDYLQAGDLPEDLQAIVKLRHQLQKCDSSLSIKEQEALLGSVELSLEQKQAHVQALCQPESAQEEATRLPLQLSRERQEFLRCGLHETDLPLLFLLRSRGCLPLPLLMPQDAENACLVAHYEESACRSMVWRLLGIRNFIKFSDDTAASAWLDWGGQFASGASAIEWANVAGAMRLSGRFAPAKRALEYAFSLGSSSGTWFEQALLLEASNGDVTEVERAYRKTIELDPMSSASWNNLGVLLAYKLERYADAEAAYRKAIELDPSDSFPWNNMGDLLETTERLAEACAAYATAATLDSNPHPYWQERHTNLQARLCSDSARQALETDDLPALHTALAQLLAESVDLAAALVSKPFIEDFLAKVLTQEKQAAVVLEALRELGFAKQARPLLLAFEAAMNNHPDMLAELEPEVQRAARLMFDRLKA